MTSTHALGVVTWLCVLTVSSWSAFLLSRQLFEAWPDQGFGLSKVSGPLLIALPVWTLSNWLGAGWSAHAGLVGAGALVAAALIVTLRQGTATVPWRRVVAIEAVWLAGLVAFGAIRSLDVSLFGGERFMDHALFAALVRGESLPPTDPWLAGFTVNYHYVGHACWALIAKFLPYPTTLVYNLVLVTLPAQFLSAACSVGGAIAPRYWWTGALVGACAGPLATIAQVVSHVGSLPSGFASTRVIAGTINEYPFFSFTHGELHAHVIALPVFVAFVALVVGVHATVTGDVADRRARARLFALLLLLPLCATALVLTSSWEAPSAAMGLALAAACVRRVGPRAWMPALLGGAVAGLVAWPFFSNVSIPALPVGWNAEGSPLGAFLLVMGLWLSPVFVWIARGKSSLWWIGVTAGLAVTAWFLPGWVVRVLLTLALVELWRERGDLAPIGRVLATWALALLFLAECVWVDDVYGRAFARVNVVFKWHLQAMVLCALAAPTFLAAMVPPGGVRRWHARHAIIVGVLAGLAMMQPLSTMAARVRARQGAPTLDSLDQVTRRYPGDAAIVSYLTTNATPGAVVLEAPGTKYTYASRISSLSGQPAVLGWAEHERLWRRGPSWDDVIRARGALVESLYAGPTDGLGDRLRDAKIEYVVVGVVERRRYPHLAEARFDAVAEVVVRVGDTVLLRVQ